MAKVYKGLYPPGPGYVMDTKAGGWVKAPKGVKGSPTPPKHVATPEPEKPKTARPRAEVAPGRAVSAPTPSRPRAEVKKKKVTKRRPPPMLPTFSPFESLPERTPRTPLPAAVKFVGKPTAEYVQKHGVGWGDVRIDPGGGYVVYADGPKDYRRARITASRPSPGPSVQPLNEQTRREQDRETPLTPGQRREREIELAIDAWLQSDDVGAKSVRDSADKTGDFLTTKVRPWLPGYITGEWARGERDMDWMTALDIALLPTVVAGPGQGVVAGGLRASMRPLSSARAGVAGLWGARGGAQAARQAARASYNQRGLVHRGVRASLRPVGRGASAVIGRVTPLASARAAHNSAKKAANIATYEARAAFLNLAAWEKNRLARIMEEQGQVKIETMMAPVTGGARPLQVRGGLERELGFSGEPAARAALGRGFEDFIDRNRDLVSRLTLGAVRDTTEEAGKRVGRQLAFQRQYAMRPAIQLQKAQSRLKGAVDYTVLRMIGENTLPEDRIAFHINRAAESPGDALFHEVQASLTSDAAKWVRNVNGRAELAENAPKRLKQMLSLLQNSAEAREDILRQLGLLSDEVIRGRIDAPGAVIKGAKWVENEVMAQHKLLTSPHRAALREFIINAGIPEGQTDAFLASVGDPAARAHIGLLRKQIERELQQELDSETPDPARIAAIRNVLANLDDEVDRHYASFANLFYGQPEDMGVIVSDMMEAMGLPEHIDADGIAREILDSGLKLPDHLRDPAVLAQRINLAWTYTKAGEHLGGKDWYDRAASNVQRVTQYINEHPRVASGKVAPVTERQTAQIFAILSAQDNTVNNVTQVRKALTQWIEKGEVWAGRNPSMRSNEVERVLKGQDWDGRKRNSFYMNIIEDIDPEEYAALMAERGETLEGDPVTVDMWIARIFGEEQPGSNYDAFERIFHRLADQAGWRPKEVQAAAWTGIKDEGIEAMKTKAIEAGTKIPPAYYLLKNAGAADAFEYGISKSFGQLSFEGLTTSPRADKAFSKLMSKPEKGGGGGTFTKSLAEAPHKTGYYVAQGAYETKIATRKMSASAIEGYRDAHRSVMERADHVGLWRNDDDGYTYLDISRWFRTKDEAMVYAKEQGQLAFYGLAEGDVPTGLSVVEADSIKSALRLDVGPQIPKSERVPHVEPLSGLPSKGTVSQEANALAEAYSRFSGIPYNRPSEYRTVNEERAKRIAEAFENMADALDPQANPAYREATVKAYRQFAAETRAQYELIQKGGYTFEFMPAGKDPYDGSPWGAMRDLKENKHMYVYPTDEGFGDVVGAQAGGENPLLEDTGLRWMQDGVEKPVTNNDLFRGVHDFFGHYKEGVGFRADGEENAWRSHSAMYSPEARRAMTTETRGQNSWVNYGPHAVSNRTASQSDTVYAPQKLGLLPEWAVTEGAQDAATEAASAQQAWDDILKQVLKQQDWKDNKLGREAAEDWLDENPTAFPGWEDIRSRVNSAREETYPSWAQFNDLTLGFLRPRGGGRFGQFDLGLQPHAADIATVTHEWGHFIRFSNFRPSDLKKLSDWTGVKIEEELPAFSTREEYLAWGASEAGKARIAAEEQIARGFEVYVLSGGGQGLPEKQRRALEVLARHIEANYDVRGPHAKRSVYQIAGLQHPWDEIPAPVRDVFDFFLTHEELKGGQFRYQEGVAKAEPGQFYVPYKRGLPVSVRHPYRTAKAFLGFRRSLPEGRGAMGAGTMDPALTHIFKAELLRSGHYDNSQIASASAQSLQKAANLQSIFAVRRALLARDSEGAYVMARATPERTDDIAVKLNPRKNSDQRLAKLHEYLGQMEKGEKVSLRDLAKQDADAFERLSAETFGGKLEGTGMGGRSRKMTDLGEVEVEQHGELQNRAARDVAQDIIDGVMEPVDNIVWVPRRFLDQLGIFEVPRTIRQQNFLSKAGGVTADVVNDYLKSSLLYLNPHYYGMNLVGNAVMNLMHEGIFAPLNLSRAFWISHQMGEETAFIDFMMGRGLMSVAELRSLGDVAAGKKISGALGHASGILVDMIPRRMAFIHEARRAGYRSRQDIENLLNDPDALYHVVTKAKRAMVDFDELSPFERDVLTRYIFVYPWMKGATMWTMRFPKEHPVQTAALLWLYEKQQDLAEEKIGPRPSYLDLVLPIGTAERYGEKYPLVFNMRQAFTASTPYEIGQNLARFATGSPNGEALSEMLQPWYGNLITSITGWDPFRHQEVSRGLPTLIKTLDPREAPGVQAVQRVLRTEEERQADAEAGRLYPRNRLDDIVQLGLGSLGWTPINPETARERAQVGPKSTEQKLLDWADEVKEQTGLPPDPEFIALKANRMRYDEVSNDLPKEHTDYDLTKARLTVYLELNPDQERNRATWEAQIDATEEKNLSKWNDWLEKSMGWDRLNKYQAHVAKWEQYNKGIKEASSGP